MFLTPSHRAGFTLVELSIVLVIIGLLTGGVLTGQSLIRAAELRSVSSQYSRYMTAVQTFRDKYFALPGDMTNATKYWNAVASGASCITTASTSAATCDGDGNGKIDISASSNEYFRFWQHLANAGLIEGSYDGIGHGSTTGATTANAPVGRITSSMWYVSNLGTASGLTYLFDGQYDNSFTFGAINANTAPYNALLKPEDAYNIDAKLDDGMPGTGKIVIWGVSLPCAGGNSSLSAPYALSTTAISCTLIFRQQF